MIRNLFSFIWDITHWNRMDIEIATDGKPNISTGQIVALWKKLTALKYTMPCITIYIETSLHPIISGENDFTWGSIDSCMHGIVYTKGAAFFQSANNFPVLLFGFPPLAMLISTRFQHVMSQMKENKFLIKFLIYYVWVKVISRELWSINLLVSYFFCTLYMHCA